MSSTSVLCNVTKGKINGYLSVTPYNTGANGTNSKSLGEICTLI